MNIPVFNYRINFAIFTGEFVCGSVAINTITKGFMTNYFKNKYGSDKFGVVSNLFCFHSFASTIPSLTERNIAVTALKKNNFDNSNKPFVEVLLLYLIDVYLVM